jgi:hypothetical protein
MNPLEEWILVVKKQKNTNTPPKVEEKITIKKNGQTRIY